MNPSWTTPDLNAEHVREHHAGVNVCTRLSLARWAICRLAIVGSVTNPKDSQHTAVQSSIKTNDLAVRNRLWKTNDSTQPWLAPSAFHCWTISAGRNRESLVILKIVEQLPQWPVLPGITFEWNRLVYQTILFWRGCNTIRRVRLRVESLVFLDDLLRNANIFRSCHQNRLVFQTICLQGRPPRCRWGPIFDAIVYFYRRFRSAKKSKCFAYNRLVFPSLGWIVICFPGRSMCQFPHRLFLQTISLRRSNDADDFLFFVSKSFGLTDDLQLMYNPQCRAELT